MRASLGVTNGGAGIAAEKAESPEKKTQSSKPALADSMFGHELSDGHRLRKLGPKELVAVRRAFNDIDQDGSGQIDIIEVRAPPLSRAVSCAAKVCGRVMSIQIRAVVEDIGLQETGEPLTKEEVDEILEALDDNGDGTISFEGTSAPHRSLCFAALTKLGVRMRCAQSSATGGQQIKMIMQR
eukprot:COSAG02_NODE_2162_length_9623_cov_3.592923_6_plen_183_part_00